MIEIYYGDGKGKTSAAAGLTIRAAGHHVPILFVQFLKDGKSGEINILKKIDEVRILNQLGISSFYFSMTDDEKQKTKKSAEKMFDEAKEFVFSEKILENPKIFKKPRNDSEIKKLLVLDEILHAVHFGLIDEEELISFLKKVPNDIEVILTGRNPSQALINICDYATEFRKEKHPFDRGIKARIGIEK